MKNSFGEIIKYKRTQNNWTAKQFIKILGCKLSPTYITKIEAHNHIPSPSVIIAMARAFNLPPEHLLMIAKTNKLNQYSQLLEKKYTT
jgi:transcriptional regulator with XRE-family HTH domain